MTHTTVHYGMDPKDIVRRGRKVTGDEREFVIQADLIALLKSKDWHVRPIGASAAVFGWPDLFAAHRHHGQRWIEVKCPEGYTFTASQLQFFPYWQSVGVGIWILTAATESEVLKLFQPPNWYTYLPAFHARGCVADVTMRPIIKRTK